jgi:hypothetical protein
MQSDSRSPAGLHHTCMYVRRFIPCCDENYTRNNQVTNAAADAPYCRKKARATTAGIQELTAPAHTFLKATDPDTNKAVKQPAAAWHCCDRLSSQSAAVGQPQLFRCKTLLQNNRYPTLMLHTAAAGRFLLYCYTLLLLHIHSPALLQRTAAACHPSDLLLHTAAAGQAPTRLLLTAAAQRSAPPPTPRCTPAPCCLPQV